LKASSTTWNLNKLLIIIYVNKKLFVNETAQDAFVGIDAAVA
jgi:hypothetical protein